MTTTPSSNGEMVREALGKSLNRKPVELSDDVVLTDLVAESFALIETVIRLQEDLGIRLVQDDLRGVISVGDLVGVCAERLE